AGDTKIGEDSQAPFAFTWTDPADGYHQIRARATNSAGLSSYSRYVRILVGDLLVKPPWKTFTNRDAQFEQRSETSFWIRTQGANTWQGTDEYGAIYQSGAGDRFIATVRLVSQTNPHGSAKAGLIARNDVTAPGVAGGYFLMHRQANGTYEALWDANGDGDIETAAGAPAGATPKWLRIQRGGTRCIGSYSEDGQDWTVLADVTLPSAGPSSDVGVFATAHHATAYIEAEYDSWSLDTDPPPPDDGEPEPEPGTPPACLGARSDDFSDETLDLDRWTVVRGADDGLHPRIEDGRLVLPVTQGDIDGPNTGPIAYVGQPFPTEGPWQAT